jgi:hypothetical protein
LETSKLWITDAKAILRYAHVATRFSGAIESLIKAECNTQWTVFEPVCQLLKKWAAVNECIAEEEMRVSDDLRDIYERFKVCLRLTEQRREGMEDLSTCQNKVNEFQRQLTSDVRKPNFDQAKADAHLAKLLDSRQKALIKAKNLTFRLLNERRRFRLFHFRRLKHALQHFGRSLTSSRSEEVGVLRKLTEALRAAQQNVSEGFVTSPEIIAAEDPKAPPVGTESEHSSVPVFDSAEVTSVSTLTSCVEKTEQMGADLDASGGACNPDVDDHVTDFQCGDPSGNAHLPDTVASGVDPIEEAVSPILFEAESPAEHNTDGGDTSSNPFDY